MEKKIWTVDLNVPKIQVRKQVAAYARVSVESERMHHSLSAQISYYSSLIQKNPEWKYAGVYADYGISGTSTERRKEFKRMLAEAEKGKIDIILTKSIQRFSRNTVDLLNTVRHLKELGIDVWFEKENIHTMSGEGELMLTILASFAQEESRSISDNIKWRFRKKFEQGIPHAKFFVYGYCWDQDNLVIQPEEANIVRKIFDDYLKGKTRKELIRDLEKKRICTRYGNFFKDSNIRQILTNRIYTGVLEIQKTFVTDPITKREVINRGEKDKYIVEHHHEAIITVATFERVQQELERRKEMGKRRGGYARDFLNTSCFTGIIECGICGKSYTHVIRRYKEKHSEYWTCESHKGKGTNCGAYGSIPQPVLKKICATVLGIDEFDENVFAQQVKKIVVPSYKQLIFYLKDGRKIERQWNSDAQKDCWTDELKNKQRQWMKKYHQNGTDKRYTAFSERICCPICGVTFTRCLDKRNKGKVAYWRCKGKNKCSHIRGIKEETLKSIVANILHMVSFDEGIFREKVKQIEIQKDGSLLFRFFGGNSKGGSFQ